VDHLDRDLSLARGDAMTYIPEGGFPDTDRGETTADHLSFVVQRVSMELDALLAALKDAQHSIENLMTDGQLDAKPTPLNGRTVRQTYGQARALIAEVEK
jgi:hypothetical protein